MNSFLKSVFSESDGTGSFARLASGFVILCVMGCYVWLTIKTGAMPAGWEGMLIFMTTSVLNLYGLNKTVTRLKK